MGAKTAQAPDYTGAAQQQGESSKEVTNMQTWANRPTLNTPWGSETWQTQSQVDPATGQPVTQWTGNINLTPEQQQALNSQQDIQQGRSDMAQNLIGSANDAISKPFDFGQSQNAGQNGADSLYAKMTSRLDPQWNTAENAAKSNLANQGLDQTSDIWKNTFGGGSQDQVGSFNRGKNDAYNQAAYTAATGGQQFEQGDIALQAQQRTMPLNLMNAALTGQQVQNPQMPNVPQAQAAQPVNYLGAATAQGNFDLANANMQNQVTGQAYGAAGNLGAAALSDERVKTDIHRQDDEALPGVPFASFKYRGDPRHRRFKGVIAQDVERLYPEKVHRGPDGLRRVDPDLAPFSFGKKRN